MMKNIQLEVGQYGTRAVITSAWDAKMGDYLRSNGIAELELNDGKGWKGDDLSFLKGLHFLKAFSIIDLKIRSVASIMALRNLRALRVITYCSTSIDFSAFPDLEDCALEWRKGAISLFDRVHLKTLFVNRYDGKDVDAFSVFHEMKSLSLLNAPIENLRGLNSLENLLSLRLANLRKLRSLGGIESLRNLRELEVHTCPLISSIEEVGNLSELRVLRLNNDGPIASLKPLQRITGLESVTFYESTNVLDGDLSPLKQQENLTRISFRNRSHYSLKREDFGTAYAGGAHA